MEFDLPLWYPLKVDLMVVLPTAEKMVLNLVLIKCYIYYSNY